MRTLLAAAAVLALLATGALSYAGAPLAPAPAYAHDGAWDDGPPKGMDDGIVCHAEASAEGHRYSYTTYIGADAGEYAANPARERAWQEAACRRYAVEDVQAYYRYSHGLDIAPSDIRITTRRT